MDNVVAPNAPAEATPSAPAATPTPSPSALPVATPQATPAAAIPAAPEDRSNWVPPHRIREIREGMQRQFAQQQAQVQAQIEQYQSQVRALTGMTPPPNPEVESIKTQFFQVFPQAQGLFEKAEQVDKYIERMGELESAVDYIWRNHGRQAIDRVFKQAEESIGAPLNDEGRRALHAAFSGWIQSVDPSGERYVSDPGIVDEFWKTLSSTLVDPARRAAAANVQNRVPGALPQDTPAGVPAPPQAPKPANIDERVAQGWAAFQANRRG